MGARSPLVGQEPCPTHRTLGSRVPRGMSAVSAAKAGGETSFRRGSRTTLGTQHVTVLMQP